MNPRLIACTTLLAVVGFISARADEKKPELPPAAKTAIDFEKHVRPLLEKHCIKCHGPAAQKGGLRLDTRAAAMEGGNSGAVIATGKSAESKLVHLVGGLDPELAMPPKGKLTAEEVGTLRAWIDQGAKWGEVSVTQPGAAKSSHWAFQPIARPAVPGVRTPKGEVRNPIDAFVLARLAKEGLAPSPLADKPTLLRRVSLDLTGLPPTPAELDAFLKDTSPDAFERAVDRLLASPHYGERWGRHWLDSARYADSDGYEKDTGRPFAWRFRDWVIRAMNDDMPFDRFTVEQLAGDLLPKAEGGGQKGEKAGDRDSAFRPPPSALIATGFHRNTLTNKEGGVDQEEFRVAAVVDRVSTTGKVWLGLTVGCAQCHDHKYDPISHREFYQLFAFFNSDREADIDAPLPGEEERLKKERAAFDAEKAKLQAAVDEAKAQKLPAAEAKKREAALAAQLKKAPAVSKAMTLALGPTRPTHVMLRGDFLRKGVEVKPGTPAVLPKLDAAAPTRLDFARWLVSAENPLTARVTVNWVWAKFFGRGLVSTPEDFGTQGQKPSHPELLDWLASEFRAPVAHAPGSPWSLKSLHRLIVTSATYRQSSAVDAADVKRDPLNVLLARQSRLRLEAEIVRDNALASSGLLSPTVGGPSIRPPQPAGISELTYANSARWVETTGPDRYKRGMYIWFQRTSPYPMLMTFDSPDSNVCTVRRERSNTPLQSLTLMNDPVFVECAQALARRVLKEQPGTDAERLAHLLKLTLARTPTPKEAERMTQLLADFRGLAKVDPKGAAALAGKAPAPGVAPEELAAWVGVGRAVMNLDEFVTRE